MSLSANDDLWEAVTEPTRRKLLDHLISRDYATATTLASEMTVSRQAICKHLARLESSGLVTSEHVGREVRFSVRIQRIAEASIELNVVAQRWNSRLLAIKQLAEQSYASRKNEDT